MIKAVAAFEFFKKEAEEMLKQPLEESPLKIHTRIELSQFDHEAKIRFRITLPDSPTWQDLHAQKEFCLDLLTRLSYALEYVDHPLRGLVGKEPEWRWLNGEDHNLHRRIHSAVREMERAALVQIGKVQCK